MSAQTIGEPHYAPLPKLAALDGFDALDELLTQGMSLVRLAASRVPEEWGVVLVHPGAPQAPESPQKERLFARAMPADRLRELVPGVDGALSPRAGFPPSRPILVIARRQWGLTWLPLADLSVGRGGA